MTEDGANGVNYPKSILDTLLGIETASGDVETFREADDFESAWAKITGVRHE